MNRRGRRRGTHFFAVAAIASAHSLVERTWWCHGSAGHAAPCDNDEHRSFPSAARRSQRWTVVGRGARPASFRVRWSSSHQRRLVSASASGRALRPVSARVSFVDRPCRRTAVDARVHQWTVRISLSGRAPGRRPGQYKTLEKPCGRFRPPIRRLWAWSTRQAQRHREHQR